MSGTGDPLAFLTYWRHPAVAPHLEPYNLGSSDFPAEQCLLIDRETNHASIAPIAAGRAFVRDQHPPPPEVSPYEIEEAQREAQEASAAIQQGWQEAQLDPDIIRQHMEEQHQRVVRMVTFLNQRIPPSAPTPGEPPMQTPPAPLETAERELANVELGDIVKLHRPYRTGSKLYGQEGAAFTHGIVAEVLSRLPDGRTRSVSLYLYNPETRQLYIGPNGIPEFVDHSCREFQLYKRATEMGYLPTDPEAHPDADA